MKILRWIAVLPVAIITLVLSNIILKFLLMLTGEFQSNSIMLIIITSIQSGALFIVSGVKTAPNYKTKTALGLLLIAILLSIINLIVTYNFYPNKLEVFSYWANNLSALFGLYFGYLWVKENVNSK